MKNRLVLFLAFFFIARGVWAQSVDVYVFGKLFPKNLRVVHGAFYVPFADFAKALQVKTRKEGNHWLVNGKSFNGPFLKRNGRLYVEIRSLAKEAGCKIIFNKETGIIDVLRSSSPLTQSAVESMEKKASVRHLRPAGAGGAGHEVDLGGMLLYVPGYMEPKEKHPLVVAFSPSGDANSMIHAWQGVADRHEWYVAASREYHNGMIPNSFFGRIAGEIKNIESRYPVDPSRIIASGFSGGGMFSHMMAFRYPDLIWAVVANTGMINRDDLNNSMAYPRGKLCVFLASPTGFRYSYMKQDQKFLQEHGWSTDWIEFQGGHTIAPSSVYEQAAEWLEGSL